jgi:hypothetical protein
MRWHGLLAMLPGPVPVLHALDAVERAPGDILYPSPGGAVAANGSGLETTDLET